MVRRARSPRARAKARRRRTKAKAKAKARTSPRAKARAKGGMQRKASPKEAKAQKLPVGTILTQVKKARAAGIEGRCGEALLGFMQRHESR